jgi:CheY-like chemotaxis protein
MGAILIVEDEPTVLMLAEFFLIDAGHLTLTAADVPQAMAIIEAGHAIDLLFTDIGLRDATQGGIALAREARGFYPGVAVLYTTGQTVTDGMRELFVEGSDLLVKPYIASDLTGAIAGMLKSRS